MGIEKQEIDKKMLEWSTTECRTIPEYIAFCRAFAKGASTIQDGIDYLSDMLDIDKAEGIWLDYIGWLVGVTRIYSDSATFFSVNNPDLNVKKYFWFGQQKAGRFGSLSDIFFRQKIKAKIAYNSSRCTRNENIRIIKGMTFADHVKIRQHREFIDKEPMTQKLVYDKTKFAVIGSPTITDEGIASGFNNENYLNTKVTVGELKNKSWSVRANWTNIGNTDTPETNTLVYFGSAIAFGSIVFDTDSKKLSFYVRTGEVTDPYSQETVAERTLPVLPDYINATLSFNIDTGEYTAIADWGEGETVLGTIIPDTENKQLYVINTTPENTILIGAGNGDSYNKNATDLKEVVISTGIKKIFYGTTEEPLIPVFEKTGAVEVTKDGIASKFGNLSYVTTNVQFSSTDFSFSCRFLPKANTVDDKYQCLVGMLDLTGEEQYRIVLNRYGRGIIFVIGDTPYGGVGAMSFDTDIWHKLDFVYKNGTATCYVDGVLQWSETVALPQVLNSTRTAIIGAYPESSQTNYGEIDLSSFEVTVGKDETFNGAPEMPMVLDINLIGDEILSSTTLLEDCNKILGNGVGINSLKLVTPLVVKNDKARFNYILGLMDKSFDLNKFTITGKPTITSDGEVSEFSMNDYVSINKTLNLTQDNSFKFTAEFKPTDLTTGNYDIFGIQNYVRAQIKSNGAVTFYIVTSDKGKEVAVNFDSVGTEYRYVLEYDKDTHNLTLTVTCDGETKTAGLELGAETFAWDVTDISVGRGKRTDTTPFVGTIDLKKFIISVDDKVVFTSREEGIDSLILADGTIAKIPYVHTTSGEKIATVEYRADCERILENEGSVTYYTIDIGNENYTLPIKE